MDKILSITSCALMVEVLDMLEYGWGSGRGDVCSVLVVHVYVFSLLYMGGNMTLHLKQTPSHLNHFSLHLLRAGSSYSNSADVWG